MWRGGGEFPNEHFVYRIRLQLLPKMVSIIEGVYMCIHAVCYSSLLVHFKVHVLHVQCISYNMYFTVVFCALTKLIFTWL